MRQLQHAQRPWLLAWLFGFAWFGAGISWVHVSIAQFGGLPLPASIGLMVLLCGYLALYPMLALGLLQRYFSVRLWPLALPFLWLLTEWGRSWLLTGFPGLSLGYSASPSYLAGWYPIIGETGVTTLLLIIAALLAQRLQRQHGLLLSLCVTVMFSAGWVFSQQSWTQPDQTRRYALVQGNIPQSLRWDPQQDKVTMQKYLDLTAPHWHNDIIIWPEAAIPQLEPLARQYLQRLDQHALEHEAALVTGIVNFDVLSDQAWNTILVLGATDSNYRYEKHHLLPIGEFVPFERWLRNLAPIFDLPMSSFSRGEFMQPNLSVNGIYMAPALCFEIAFPRQIAANVTADSGVILTLSNDAWFGNSHGPAQHLQIAQVRAAEFGRPVLRATNNGITAMIAADGSLVARLPQFETAVLSASLTSRVGKTPFHQWGVAVHWLLLVALFVLALVRQQRLSQQNTIECFEKRQ